MNETQPAPAAATGWYLYGIVLDPGSEVLDAGIAGVPGEDALRLIRHGELAAIAAPVPLAEYDAEALRPRLRDPDWLEAAVRRHHAVVERIHSAQIILPAKFGAVYASVDDVRHALERGQEELRDRLAALNDCDEWSVHLYATARQALERVATRDAPLDQLEQ
ncbi:MAG: GvpL/GvpF family gas vesicle protein, partial [Kofleriaceae bacterium]